MKLGGKRAREERIGLFGGLRRRVKLKKPDGSNAQPKKGLGSSCFAKQNNRNHISVNKRCVQV